MRRGAVRFSVVAHRVLEHRDVDDAVGAGDADARDEFADRLGRHAAPAQAREGRHARIVPADDMALVDQPLSETRFDITV